jgi:hypothetical protein
MAFLLDHLYRATPQPAADAGTDADLLTGYVAARDEATFAALVRRHGADPPAAPFRTIHPLSRQTMSLGSPSSSGPGENRYSGELDGRHEREQP